MNPYLESDPTTLSNDGELYKRCVEQWGIEPPLNMVTEELGELIVAIQKWKRKPSEKTVHDIASEVADVELMLGQLQYMMDSGIERKYGVHLEEEREYKRFRLKARLKIGQDDLESTETIMIQQQDNDSSEGGGR
jgi:NTP pyrophosphatase (non-canonical NTP hydrolase)